MYGQGRNVLEAWLQASEAQLLFGYLGRVSAAVQRDSGNSARIELPLGDVSSCPMVGILEGVVEPPAYEPRFAAHLS